MFNLSKPKPVDFEPFKEALGVKLIGMLMTTPHERWPEVAKIALRETKYEFHDGVAIASRLVHSLPKE